MCGNLRFFFLMLLTVMFCSLTVFSGAIHAEETSQQTFSAPIIMAHYQLPNSTINQTPNVITAKDKNINTESHYIQDNPKAQKMFQHRWFYIAGEFWLLGLLLAFIPCILPLLLIIAGFLGNDASAAPQRRPIFLSITYVLALSSTYAVAGVITATFGIYLQAYFQMPWVIFLFSIIIVILAMSLLGFYQLKLPDFLQHHIVRHNKIRAHYKYIQVAVMGVLATLIASPCLAAPLITILGYIGSTGSIILGAIALFFVGIGIGTPLLVASTLGKQIIPHDTKWQPMLKVFFGLALLGVAIWTASRIIPSNWNMLLWSILIIYTANYMYSLRTSHFNHFPLIWKSFCILILSYGLAIFFGGMMGNANPLNPLSLSDISSKQTTTLIRVIDLTDFNNKLDQAKTENMPVIVYFTAKWCESCRIFKNQILQSSDAREILQQFKLLKVDLTYTNTPPYDISEKYKIVGTPEVIFFTASGELYQGRIAGIVSVDTFMKTLEDVSTAK